VVKTQSADIIIQFFFEISNFEKSTYNEQKLEKISEKKL
jgi:hypothetical protein